MHLVSPPLGPVTPGHLLVVRFAAQQASSSAHQLASLPAGVIGGFIGSLVTAFMGLMLDRRRETKATELRQEERRRIAYVELLAAGGEYFLGQVNEHYRPPSSLKPFESLQALAARLETARYVVEMVAGAECLPDARAYYRALMDGPELDSERKEVEEDWSDYAVEMETKRYVFVNTARTELGEPVANNPEEIVRALISDEGSTPPAKARA